MKKQNFIEVNSDKELLKQESYDRFISDIKNIFKIDNIKDLLIYIKTKNDGFFLVEPSTYKDLKNYLKNKDTETNFDKSVNLSKKKECFFRSTTNEYIIKEKIEIGFGYIKKEDFKNENIGRDIKQEEFEENCKRFSPEEISNKSIELLNKSKEEEKQFLIDKKNEMNEAYSDFIKKINDLTRNKNIYYKTYFEKVLRNKFKEKGIELATPEDINVDNNDMKCCFCGETLKTAFHYQGDENYVVCQRCVEIHSDFYPFNFVKNRKK